MPDYITPNNPILSDWSARQAQSREEFLARYQQMLAQRAAAAATAAQNAESKSRAILPGADPTTGLVAPVANPYGDPAALAAASTQPQQGFWNGVVNRAAPETGAMLAGAGALAADLVGADSVRDYMADKASSWQQYAAETAPRQVPTIEDIGSLSSFGTWASETLQDQLPNLAAMATGVGAAGVGARAAASALGRVGMQRAAQAGLIGTAGALEGGEAYLQDYATHGATGTSPWMDLGKGAINGALESIMGMEGSILKSILGKPVSQAAEATVRKGLTGVLSNMTRGASKEGATEALQEVVGAVNANIQDNKDWITADDLSAIMNAAAAGALLGGPMGSVEQLTRRKADLQRQGHPDVIGTAAEDAAIQPTESEAFETPTYNPEAPARPAPAQGDFDRFYQNLEESIPSPRQTLDATRERVLSELGLPAEQQALENLQTNLEVLNDLTNPETRSLSEDARKRAITNVKRKLASQTKRLELLQNQAQPLVQAAQEQTLTQFTPNVQGALRVPTQETVQAEGTIQAPVAPDAFYANMSAQQQVIDEAARLQRQTPSVQGAYPFDSTPDTMLGGTTRIADPNAVIPDMSGQVSGTVQTYFQPTPFDDRSILSAGPAEAFTAGQPLIPRTLQPITARTMPETVTDAQRAMQSQMQMGGQRPAPVSVPQAGQTAASIRESMVRERDGASPTENALYDTTVEDLQQKSQYEDATSDAFRAMAAQQQRDSAMKSQLESYRSKIADNNVQVTKLTDALLALKQDKQMTPAERNARTQQIQNSLTQAAARRSVIEDENKSAIDKLNKAYSKAATKLTNDFISSSIEAATKDPRTTAALNELSTDAATYSKRTTERLIARSAQITKELAAVQKTMLQSMNRPAADMDMLRIMRDQLRSEKTNIVQQMSDIAKLNNQIQAKTKASNKDSYKTMLDANADAQKLYNMGNIAEDDVTRPVNMTQWSALSQRRDSALQGLKAKAQAIREAQTQTRTLTDQIQAQPQQAQPQQALPPTQSVADAAIERVNNAMTTSLKTLPLLADRIDVVYGGSPSANTIAVYTPQGRIVLFANNIMAKAGTNPNPSNKTVKDIVARAIVHEGVVHHGLRVIFNTPELQNFLNMVDKSFRDTDTWKKVTRSIANFESLDPITQAEEFVARLVERKKAGRLTSEGRGLWSKFKTFVRTVLRKLGYDRITEDDIFNVARVAAYRLSGEATTQKGTPYKDSTIRAKAPSQTLMSEDVSFDTPRAKRAQEAVEGGVLSDLALTNPLASAIQKVTADRSDTIEKLKEVLVDANRPIQRMIDAVKERGGKLDYTTNVYKNLQHLPNKVAIRAREAFLQKIEPMLERIAKLDLGNPKLDGAVKFGIASDYAEALAARERNDAYGEQVTGLSTEEAQRIIDKYEPYASGQLMPIVSDLQKIHELRLNILEGSGFPKSTIDAWRSKYKYYMPFKNWEEAIKEYDPSWYNSDTRKSLSTPGGFEKITARVKGRNTEAQNAINHAILQLFDVINLSEKIPVQRSLYKLAVENSQMQDIFEIVEMRTPENKDTWPGWKRTVDRVTGKLSWTKTKSSAEGHMDETVACILEDGSIARVWIKDPSTARALRGENIVHAQGIVKTVGAINQMLGQLYTSRNPFFWITNPIRDVATAWLNMTGVHNELRKYGIAQPRTIGLAILKHGLGSVYNPFKGETVRSALMKYYSTGAMPTMKDEKLQAYMKDLRTFIQEGGQTEYFGAAGYEQLSRGVIKAVRDKNPVTKAQKGAAICREIGDYMDNMSSSLENMTRYIAFKEIKDSLLEAQSSGLNNLTDDEINKRAANIALNLTVNFTRKGSWAPVFNSLYMFASASIGGNVRMLETIFRKNPATGKTDWKHAAKFVAYPMLAYMAQAAIARMMMPDDDDGLNTYDKIPDYIKNSNIIIPSPSGDGGYVKIPLPYGFNIFWTMARNLLDSYHAKANDSQGPSFTAAGNAIMKSLFDNFTITGSPDEGWTMFVPAFAKPFAQLSANVNFAGNPIYPESTHLVRGHIPDSEKYWSTTSKVVRDLCQSMNSLTGGSNTKSGLVDVSPETIDFLVNSYGGGIGRLFNSMLTVASNASEGKPVNLGQMPGASSLYHSPTLSDTSAMFTKLRLEAQTNINAVDTMKRDPNLSMEERLSIMQDNKAGYSLKKLTDSTTVQLNKLRAAEKALEQRASKMSLDQMQKRREAIDNTKKRLMQRYIKAATEKGLRIEEL